MSLPRYFCVPDLGILTLLSLMNKVVQFRVLGKIYSQATMYFFGMLRQQPEPKSLSRLLNESFRQENYDASSQVSYPSLWVKLSNSTMIDDQTAISGEVIRCMKGSGLTMTACYRDFQVSKYLQNSAYDEVDYHVPEPDRHKYQVMRHDVALVFLAMIPLHHFTKTQKINLSNRLLQVLAERSIAVGAIAQVLGLLVSFTETPSSSMVLLKKPDLTSDEIRSGDPGASTTWLFAIAAWLDDIAREAGPDILTIVRLKQLATLVLQ